MLQGFSKAMEVSTSSSSGRRSIDSGTTIPSSVSFSQSTSARGGLEILQSLVGSGYLRDRGTGMSDLVVTSRPILLDLLRSVEPFVTFKREHARRVLDLLPRLGGVRDPERYLQLAREVDTFATLNYSKTKRITAVDVERHLRSTGVLCPCNDFLACHSEGMASEVRI
jgi:hypothetical protein